MYTKDIPVDAEADLAVKKPIAGGTNGTVAVALPRTQTRPSRGLRFLESEPLLAAVLLAPTVVLLGMFIAYNARFASCPGVHSVHMV